MTNGPDTSTALNTPGNPLSFALSMIAPPRITPQMLEGMRDTNPKLEQRTPGWQTQLQQPMTNEQIAAMAMQPLMARI